MSYSISELDDINQKLTLLRSITNAENQPNFSVVARLFRDLDFVNMNIKFFGYDMARRLAEELPPPMVVMPAPHKLPWKASIQADLESQWARYWLSELKASFLYHRKLWEFAYLLQNLHGYGCLREGARALGFGCGEEPLPSYFASRDINVTITDLEPSARESTGWLETGQHATSLDLCLQSNLVSLEKFRDRATLQYVDMNAIPDSLRDYDFCWSICALEHLGTIEKGLAFIEASLDTLKPGGVAIHTTEFNFGNDDTTIDNWGCVYFQREHFRNLARRLRARGYIVPEIDFQLGDGPMDRFIDLPPYQHEASPGLRSLWPAQQHLKLVNDGIASTCFGIVVQKPL